MKRCLLLLTMMLMLCACVPTPKGDVVVNKGEDCLESLIAASPVSDGSYDAPAALNLDEFGTEQFKVIVNASIEYPTIERCPVVGIEQRVFAEDWMRNIMLCMSEGKTIYSYENEIPQTKGEILSEIAMLQAMITNPEAYLPQSIAEEIRQEQLEQWQRDLLTWQEAYKTAPDEFTENEINLFTYDYAAQGMLTGAVDLGNRRRAYLTIYGKAGQTGGSPFIFSNYSMVLETGSPYVFELEIKLSHDRVNGA